MGKQSGQQSRHLRTKTNQSGCIAAGAGPSLREVSPRIVSPPRQQTDIDHLPACRFQLAAERFHKTSKSARLSFVKNSWPAPHTSSKLFLLLGTRLSSSGGV